MADTEKKCFDLKKAAATFLKIAVGIAFLVLGGMAIWKWWESLLLIMQGGAGLFLILAGIITLAVAKE